MSVPIAQETIHIKKRNAPAQSWTSRVDAVSRRTLDILVSGLVLLLLFLPLAIVALLIRLDSPGPVLFIQRRVGKDGVEFPVFKFRSMYQDAEARLDALLGTNERSGPVFKMRDDPRVTRMGSPLRAPRWMSCRSF